MARREWAEKEVTKRLSDGWSGDALVMGRNEAMDMLIKQHARAVRIMKRAKRLELHGLRDTDTNEFLEGYEAACVDILSALKKGRA